MKVLALGLLLSSSVALIATAPVLAAGVADNNVVMMDSGPLPTSINDMGRVISGLKRSLSGLAHEVDRKAESECDPEILDQAMLSDPLFTATPAGSGGMLPPRQEWMDLYLFQIEKLVGMLQTEVNNACQSVGSYGDNSFDVSEMKKIATDLVADLPRLKAVAGSSMCDDDQLMMACQNMYSDVQGLDNARRQIARTMKKIAAGKMPSI